MKNHVSDHCEVTNKCLIFCLWPFVVVVVVTFHVDYTIDVYCSSFSFSYLSTLWDLNENWDEKPCQRSLRALQKMLNFLSVTFCCCCCCYFSCWLCNWYLLYFLLFFLLEHPKGLKWKQGWKSMSAITVSVTIFFSLLSLSFCFCCCYF